MAKRGKKKKIRRNYQLKKVFNTPISIRIVSIFFYVIAVLTMFFGLAVFIGSIFGVVVLTNADQQKLLESVPGLSMFDIIIGESFLAALIFVGFFIIIWGGIEFLIGKGLWKGNKLAFIAALILILIGFSTSLGLLLALSYSALFGLLLYGALGYLLIINKKSREFFGITKRILRR